MRAFRSRIVIAGAFCALVTVPAFAQKTKPPTAAEFQALTDQVNALSAQVATLTTDLAAETETNRIQQVQYNGIADQAFRPESRLTAIEKDTIDPSGSWLILWRRFDMRSTPPLGSIEDDFTAMTLVLQSNGPGGGSGTATTSRRAASRGQRDHAGGRFLLESGRQRSLDAVVVTLKIERVGDGSSEFCWSVTYPPIRKAPRGRGTLGWTYVACCPATSALAARLHLSGSGQVAGCAVTDAPRWMSTINYIDAGDAPALATNHKRNKASSTMISCLTRYEDADN
jgi:hypothetical protein